MGLLGFGGSKSKSSSSSVSSSFDNLDSFGFNFGQTGSDSLSTSRSGSTSRSRIAFEDIFQNLFSGASATAAGIDTGALSGAANLLFSSGGGFLDNLRGGGAGADYLENELSRSSSLVDEQIGALSGDLGKFLNETILPGIKSSGVQAGTLGGGRGEVAKGIASEGLISEFAKGSTNIRLAERARLSGIANDLAANELARSTSGLSALPGLFDLASGGTMASLSPLLALSQILGGPTVLSDSDSSSFSDSLASSFGLDFGLDSTTGRAGSSSRSSSSSSSKSFNLGFK